MATGDTVIHCLTEKNGFTLWLSNWHLVTGLSCSSRSRQWLLHTGPWHCTGKPTIWSGPEPSSSHLHIYLFWQRETLHSTKKKPTSNYKTDFFNLLFFLFFPLSIPPFLSNTHLHTPTFSPHPPPLWYTLFLWREEFKNLYSLNAFLSFFSLEMCNLYLYFSWFLIFHHWVMILILGIVRTEMPLHVLDWSEIFLHIFPS